MSTTYTEAVQAQANIMLKIAARLDEKGYAIVAHALNREATNDHFGHGYVLGGLGRFLTDWAKQHDLAPVIVHIQPVEWTKDPISNSVIKTDMSVIARSGKIFDHPFIFLCKIPNRVRYKSIHASLELMANVHKKHASAVAGPGALDAARTGDLTEYKGDSKAKLEILLRVLEMPQHREILKAPTTRRFA